MAEPFKNMYNKQFFDLLTKDLRLVIDDFDAHGFVCLLYTSHGYTFIADAYSGNSGKQPGLSLIHI